jgi:hypothetical protein
MDLFINKLRIKLSESTPDNELIERILPKEDKDWKYESKIFDEKGEVREYAFLEDIVYFLCCKNIDAVKKVATDNNVSNKDLIKLTEITLDFTVWKNIPDCAFYIIDNFFLDENRTTYGVLLYVKKLLDESDFQKASDVIKNYRRKIIPEQLSQWGLRLFEQAMTFEGSVKERDYTKAFQIKKIFLLEPETINYYAHIQYDYNMNNGYYLQAAEIAKVFQLDRTRMKRAAIKAFEIEFKKFREKFDNGDYVEKSSFKPDDPYIHAVSILSEYDIMEERHSTDAFATIYYKEASDIAFFFLKKIMDLSESRNVNFFIKSFFCSNIIADYHLYDVVNIERAVASNQIIGEVVKKLNKFINNVEEAENYYKPVLKLFSIYTSHKSSILDIACKMFDIFVKSDKIEQSYKTYVDFKLEKSEITKILMNRCLVLLKRRKVEEFLDFIETFSIVSDIKEINEFMEQVYINFDKYIFERYFDDAIAISAVFKFPRKKIVSTACFFCKELLLKEDDDGAVNVINKFDLSYSNLKKVFSDIYNIRVNSSWKGGYDFRLMFGISVANIGFFKWILREFFRLERLSTWYLGKEIDAKKKNSN